MSTLAEQVIGLYDIGDEVELRATFTNDDGDPADPSGGVVITYRKPDGTLTTPSVSNPAVGTYVSTVVPAAGEHGDWWWRVVSSGDIKQASERSFHVRKQRVA